MRIKKDINFNKFMDQVDKCQGEVMFYTDEEDILNLKSTLSKLIFASLANKPEFLLAGYIKADLEVDYELLKEYLVSDIED
ncbi:MAG: hypothetical protein GX995_09400 [Clostridiales bacterium]|nr:hypothetical protein [Clostridiales bacterium]